jgi:hypothetical protein
MKSDPFGRPHDADTHTQTTAQVARRRLMVRSPTFLGRTALTLVCSDVLHSPSLWRALSDLAGRRWPPTVLAALKAQGLRGDVYDRFAHEARVDVDYDEI